MSTRRVGPRPPGAQLRPLMGGWFLLVLLLQSACATGVPRGALMAGYRYRAPVPPPAPREYVTLTPSSDFAPVQVSDAELREAFTNFVLEVPLRVAARPTRPLAGRLVLASWPPSGAGPPASRQATRVCASGAALRRTASGSWGTGHTTPP